MKLISGLAAMVGAGAVLGLAATAQAAVYTLSFTDYGATINLDATVTTSDTLNAVNGYDITAITGTVSGNPGSDPITGLVVNPNQPFAWNCCGFIVDNVLFSPGQTFDNWGVLFDTVGGRYNFWMNSPTEGELYTYGAPQSLDVRGTVVATSGGVPEPAAWVMMILGFGGAGAVLRRRRALSLA
ncbi:MAG: PEPxxWA-CTERM sorting domain-containing protein [Phenylobacterium sp.]